MRILTRSFRMALLREQLGVKSTIRKLSNSHNENHFLLQFPIIIILRADLPIEVQELLQLLVP